MKSYKEISQQEWQKIIDLVPGSIYYVDKRHTVILCNKGQAQAIDIDNPHSVVGKNSLTYMSNKEIIIKNNNQVMNEKKPFIFEELIEFFNGKHQWMLSHKAPVIEDGEVKGVVGVSIDITKQKQYEKELLKQKKMLQHALDSNKVFLNNISHEIRTPIHIIGAVSEALNEDRESLSQEQIKELTTLLVGQNERLKKYAEKIFELAKNAQHVDKYNFKEYDLSHILSYVISEMRFLATHIEFKAIETKITLDHMKIKSVISNVIDNAIKYGEDKNIIITMEDQGDYITVAVKNKGVVSEKELSLMFEPFYQCEKTRTGAGGVGLGLSICKEIIIAHKGYIWAESKDGNVTVFFKLPK
jgi:two-component system sensor histidine kinase VicK